MAIKKEKKAKRALLKEYKAEEDNLNREETFNVLDLLEKVNQHILYIKMKLILIYLAE